MCAGAHELTRYFKEPGKHPSDPWERIFASAFCEVKADYRNPVRISANFMYAGRR